MVLTSLATFSGLPIWPTEMSKSSLKRLSGLLLGGYAARLLGLGPLA